MHSRRWTPALLFMALFAMQSAAATPEPPKIGVAKSIKPNAESGFGANLQTLSPGSELHASETVRTGNLGQADLLFIDNTNLTVGPTSEVVLDKFVYDPTGSKGSVVLQATRGTFRFVTGTQDHRAYHFNTPFGTLGVRGTVVRVEVLDPKEKKRRGDRCDVRVTVDQGAGEFTTPDNQVHQVKAGQSICVKDGAVTYSSAQAPPSPSTPPGGPTPPPCITQCLGSPVR